MEKAAIYIINSLQNGGAERVVITQAEALLARGIKVIILTLRDLEMYAYPKEIELITLTKQKKFTKIQYLTQMLPLIHKLNQQLKALFASYDVVLLSSHLLYPNLITRLSSFRKRCMYVIHGSFFIVPHANHIIFRLFLRWLYHCQQVVCVGEGLKKEMRELYQLHQDTLAAINNPLNFPKIDEKLKEDFTPYPHPYLLYCGRLSDEKRPDRMLEVFYQGGFYHTHHLVYLGIGPWQERLEALVATYGIQDRVYFALWQDNPYQWMKHADLFVLTSDHEGLSMVLLEALYCECPVVSVDCEFGPDEILVGALKAYLATMEIPDLVEKIRLALRTYPDHLRQYALPFDVNQHIDRYLDTYATWNV